MSVKGNLPFRNFLLKSFFSKVPKHILRIGSVTNSSGYAIAEQVEAEKCTACKLCAVICPDMAISVYR